MKPSHIAALAVTMACGAREPAVSVEVTANVRAPLERVVAATGEVFDIHEAQVTLTSISLLPCEGAATAVWRWLSPISTAHAHEGSHAVEAAAQSMIIVLGESTPQPLALLSPVAGSFCELELVFGPSGGASLHVAGDRTDAEGVTAPFHIHAADVRVAKVPVSITLDEAHRERAIALELTMSSVNLTRATAGAELLDLIAGSVRAR